MINYLSDRHTVSQTDRKGKIRIDRKGKKCLNLKKNVTQIISLRNKG